MFPLSEFIRDPTHEGRETNEGEPEEGRNRGEGGPRESTGAGGSGTGAEVTGLSIRRRKTRAIGGGPRRGRAGDVATLMAQTTGGGTRTPG